MHLRVRSGRRRLARPVRPARAAELPRRRVGAVRGRECTLRLIARDAFGNACSAESCCVISERVDRPPPPDAAGGGAAAHKESRPPPPKKPAVVEHGRVRVVGQAAEGNVIVDCRLVAQAPGPHLLEVRAPGGGHAVGSPRVPRCARRRRCRGKHDSLGRSSCRFLDQPGAHRRPKPPCRRRRREPACGRMGGAGGLKPPPISPGAAGGEGPLSARQLGAVSSGWFPATRSGNLRARRATPRSR